MYGEKLNTNLIITLFLCVFLILVSQKVYSIGYAGGFGNNSNMTIWDETDFGIIYGDSVKVNNENIIFFVNYTNSTDGQQINQTNDYCQISFNVSGVWTAWTNMTYNTSIYLYENYTRFISSGTYDWNVSCYSNDYDNLNTTDNTNVSSTGYLEVNLVLPPGNTSVERYDVFDVNATVYCRGGYCGNVFGSIMYNLTSNLPDTPINETYSDIPLFLNESSPTSTKSCLSNMLSPDDFCNLTWKVNLTGNIGSTWMIGSLFNSSFIDVIDNHTNNISITSISCLEQITLRFSTISFSNVNPNTFGNNAIGNVGNEYNVTNSGTCLSNIWVKTTNLTNTTLGSQIPYYNISFNNATNDYSTSFRLTNNFSQGNGSFKTNVPSSTNITGYYFVNVPPIYAGNYIGNVTFCLNSSDTSTLCE